MPATPTPRTTTACRTRARLARLVAPAVLALCGLSPICARPAEAPHATNADYRLGPGDVVRISISGYPDMGVEARVSESGKLSYPFIGQIPVGGLSTSQAEALIAQRLVEAAIVKQPQVSLLVMQFESQKVAVLGQVVKPGQYALEKTSHLIDALALAGGTLNESAADEATLLRKEGSKLSVDLKALFEGDTRQNPLITGGDTLFVPRAPQFYIRGEVQRAGVYKLERNMTVSQAVAAGGGLTQRGSASRIDLQRRDAQGQTQDYSAKPSDLVAADDVLVVKESLF